MISSILPFTRRFLIAPGAMAISRSLLFLLGFMHIRHQRFIVDPDHPDAPPGRTNRHAVPIVISNHVSWLDILLLQYLYSAAYVTRAETRKTPIVGGVCDALPCIYVDRDKQHTPDSSHTLRTTTDKIVERARLKWQDPKARLRPLAIFPEVCQSLELGSLTFPSWLRPSMWLLGSTDTPLVLSSKWNTVGICVQRQNPEARRVCAVQGYDT